MSEPRDVTIYADGSRNIEVVQVTGDPRAPVERTMLLADGDGQPEPKSFMLRRGDFLIVRRED